MHSKHIFATMIQFFLEDNQVIMGCRGVMNPAPPNLAYALAVWGVKFFFYGILEREKLELLSGLGQPVHVCDLRKRMITGTFGLSGCAFNPHQHVLCF